MDNLVNWPSKRYSTIVVDPPWPPNISGKRNRSKGGHGDSHIPFNTMSASQIRDLPMAGVARDSAMCWTWTTNADLELALQCSRAWGFKYLTTVTMVKPSGVGNWFISRTQHIVVGYRGRLSDVLLVPYMPTVVFADPVAEATKSGRKPHSRKPGSVMAEIARRTAGPHIEIFAREVRPGFDGWGDQYEGNT